MKPQREVLHLFEKDARRSSWKNGRGFTRELALWPPEAAFERGDYQWRISTASVKESGPFSTFDGFDRILVVTNGAGLILAHGEHAPRARVRALEPYLFAGDWPTTAELAGGAVDDFNVIFSSGRFKVDVESLKLGRRRVREELAAGDAFVHVVAGEIAARLTGEEEPFVLGRRESLWARALVDGDELDLHGNADDTLALLVRIVPAREGAT